MTEAVKVKARKKCLALHCSLRFRFLAFVQDKSHQAPDVFPCCNVGTRMLCNLNPTVIIHDVQRMHNNLGFKEGLDSWVVPGFAKLMMIWHYVTTAVYQL